MRKLNALFRIAANIIFGGLIRPEPDTAELGRIISLATGIGILGALFSGNP